MWLASPCSGFFHSSFKIERGSRVQFLLKFMNAIFSLQQNDIERSFPWSFSIQLSLMYKSTKYINSNHNHTTKKESKVLSPRFFFSINQESCFKHSCIIVMAERTTCTGWCLFVCLFVCKRRCNHLSAVEGTFT